MNKWKIVTISILIFGTSFVAAAQQDAMELRVQEPLEDFHISAVERHARLLAMGSEAVLPLCAQLETYEYPSVIINVLRDIQDPRAVPALVEFLGKRRGQWGERSPDVLSYMCIRTLKELNDSRAETLLLDIASNDSVHISLRFDANTALARFGSPAAKKRASDEILNRYRTREGVSHTAHPDREVIMTYDFYLGLCEVQTDEIDKALASYITGGARYGERGNVIALLGRREETRDREKIIDALLHVAEHEYKETIQGYELALQALAFGVLFRLEAVSPEKLLAIAETWDDAIASGYATFGPDAEFIKDNGETLLDLKEQFLEKYPHLRSESNKDESDAEN